MKQVIVQGTPLRVWYEVVLEAERASNILLPEDSEHYLVTLLMRYTNQPHFATHAMGFAYLESLAQLPHNMHCLLRDVGDQCLLLAGFFPKYAQRRRVSERYFLELGKMAYDQLALSEKNVTTALYQELVFYFESMTCILQALRSFSNMEDKKPYDIYTKWKNSGQKRHQH